MPHEDGPAPAAEITLESQSSADAVRGTLSKLHGAWEAWGVAPGLCAAAEQILAEVLNNIVEHAHRDQTDGQITVKAKFEGDAIGFEVLDDGAPMPDGELPSGELAQIGGDVETLPEGGFGWFLIRTMSKDLAYQRRGEWNRLTFRVADVA